MNRFTLSLFAFLLAGPASANSIDVTSIGYGTTTTEAREDALRAALEKASGSTMFVMRSSGMGTGSRERVTSTSVTSGSVDSFKVKSEDFIGGKYRVVVDAQVTPSIKQRGTEPVEVRRWEDEAFSISQTQELQRKLREYKSLLTDFTGTLVEQLRSGYSISLRSYEITQIKGDSLDGNLLIDIHVNTSYWNTYYEILRALEPVNTTNIVFEGPLDSKQRSRKATAVGVDGYLSGSLARPVPIRVGVDGIAVTDVVLFKNAAYQGWGLVERINSAQVDSDLAAYRSVGLPLGNQRIDGIFDNARSELDCMPSYHKQSSFTCGNLITLKLPFTVKDERTLTARLQRGFFYGVMPSKTAIQTPGEYWAFAGGNSW